MLRKALTGHLEEVVLALLKTPAQFDADELRAAMKVNASSLEHQTKVFKICFICMSVLLECMCACPLCAW